MASILDLLNTQTGETLIQKASNSTSESQDKVSSVMAMALPLIVSAMKRNAQDPHGARSLNQALEDEKHNGSLLNNLGNMNEGEIQSEGSKILNHVLGGKQGGVTNTISKAMNMDQNSVSRILQMAAPVIMGLLGNQKRKDGVGESNLTDLLGSVLGSNASHDSSLIESLLDADGDGSVIDDVAGMFLGNQKDKKGGLLGGLFGGK